MRLHVGATGEGRGARGGSGVGGPLVVLLQYLIQTFGIPASGLRPLPGGHTWPIKVIMGKGIMGFGVPPWEELA